MPRRPTLVPPEFFAWRTPLLPFDTLEAWAAGAPALPAETIVEHDEALRERLIAIVSEPMLREALFVASPPFAHEVQRWLDDPVAHRALEPALVRYVARAASRCTPFGLFAGCATGKPAHHTRLTLGPREACARHTRLDTGYVAALVDALTQDRSTRERLRFRTNTSLYAIAGRLRYIEHDLEPQTRARRYRLTEIGADDYVTDVLAQARSGASIDALATALAQAQDVPLDQARDFVHELIDSQLLVADIEPCITGEEPAAPLLAQLREAAPAVAQRLGEAQASLAAVDAQGLGVAPERYRGIAEGLESLPAELELARLFQVNLVKPSPAATLGRGPLQEIQRGAELLRRLAGARDPLASFRARFAARYEGRVVPLVDALDEELGIGLSEGHNLAADASPLLDGLPFPATEERSVDWSARDQHRLKLLSRALLAGETRITLSDEDIEALAHDDAPPLPDAFAMMAQLVTRSEEDFRLGRYQVRLLGGSGPSGARLLGRFCYGDPELRAAVERHVRAEEALQPDAIFAEIVHLPEGRVGNVLLRPELRRYEIAYLGRSGVAPSQQIPIDDLLLCFTGGRLVLRSRRLGREVVPRLTSAHNFDASTIAVYRLLCLLQSQGVAGSLGWSWGPLEGAPSLPRVEHGRLILARATWHLDAADLKPLRHADRPTRFSAVQALRERLRWPRWIMLSDFDNELCVDLDNSMLIEAFLDALRGRTQARICELLPAPDALCATGPEGRFCHELVVPFVRREPALPAVAIEEAASDATRAFPAGSEWLFAKLYGGPSIADDVLLDTVAPLASDLRRAGLIDGWFFIRYFDHGEHLRIRFHGEPSDLTGEVLPRLQGALAPLIEQGQLESLQLDSYVREVERYGGTDEALRIAEAMFEIDSEAVLRLLRLLPDADADARWRWALLGSDRWLRVMGQVGPAGLSLMQQVAAGFAQEHHVDATLRRELGRRFRPVQRRLAALLDGQADDPDDAAALEALDELERRLAPHATRLRVLAEAGQLNQPLAGLAPSYVHMWNNRLLPSAQRAHEMVLYDFLQRLYRSQQARSKGGRQ